MPDLWNQGNIVLVMVRVRERGDRLQCSVQQASLYQGAGVSPDGFTIPEWLQQGARPMGPTASAPPATSTTPRAEPPTTPTPPPPAPPPPASRLHISLRETDDYGEVRWDCTVTNQDAELVAQYDVLTLVAKTRDAA